MRIPKTPAEFDYDLWTTEDGKCMVRVKRTGEVSEVDRDVMRVLRAEEKKIRRSYESGNTSEEEDGNETHTESVLSLDALPDDDVKSPAWLADPANHVDEVIYEMMLEAFCATLPPKQLDVFLNCMVPRKSLSAYAKEIGVDYTTIKEARNAIRKKYKIFFEVTP